LFLAGCVGSLFFISLAILRTKLVEINEYAIVFIAAGIIETVGVVANNISKHSVKSF
jgi:hypothetical protein